MKEENINIRLFILNNSLEIENALSKILKEIISIPKPDSKTLSNKSSSLSFKTKADLLYDLERINKEEYNLLILFMEIRNQFIHNIEATSFEKVFEIIGNNKKAKLLRLDEQIEKHYSESLNQAINTYSPENFLKIGFSKLKTEIDKILIREYEKLISDIKNETKIQQSAEMNKFSEKMLEFFTKAIDDFAESYEKHLKKITGSDVGFDKTLNNFININVEKKLKEHFPEFRNENEKR